MRRVLAPASAAAAAGLLALAGINGVAASGGRQSASGPDGGRVYRSAAYGFSVRAPAGWERSSARLVPLLAPREVLSIGTFPMRPGGGGNCGREPAAALRRMRRGDVLVTVQEYTVTPRMRPGLRRAFPPLAARPGVGRLSRSWVPGAAGVRTTTIAFGEHGRAFDALVYFGGRPGREEREAVGAVLRGMRFGRDGAFVAERTG